MQAQTAQAGRSLGSLVLGCRAMSSTAKVWVDKNTRVICQGFTGKQVRAEAQLAARNGERPAAADVRL